jgi:hypothetical protein
VFLVRGVLESLVVLELHVVPRGGVVEGEARDGALDGGVLVDGARAVVVRVGLASHEGAAVLVKTNRSVIGLSAASMISTNFAAALESST